MTPSPGRRDPADIFSNMGRASDPATQAQAATPRAHTEVVSSRDGGTLVTDDPNTLVEAVVRPNHNYGGIPAGMTVRLPFREFEANQAALCSKAEYAIITARQASPSHQALQRQLQEMRAATSDAFNRSLKPEKRAELEAARRQAAADDNREDRLRQEVAQAAQAARPQPAPAAPPAFPETPEALDALIAQRRAASEHAAAGALPRVAERLRALMDEEELELRQAFVAAQQQRQEAAQRAQQMAEMTLPPADQRAFLERSIETMGQGTKPQVYQATPEERLKKLADLFAAGLLTAEVYQQRQAEIARDL